MVIEFTLALLPIAWFMTGGAGTITLNYTVSNFTLKVEDIG